MKNRNEIIQVNCYKSVNKSSAFVMLFKNFIKKLLSYFSYHLVKKNGDINVKS